MGINKLEPKIYGYSISFKKTHINIKILPINENSVMALGVNDQLAVAIGDDGKV